MAIATLSGFVSQITRNIFTGKIDVTICYGNDSGRQVLILATDDPRMLVINDAVTIKVEWRTFLQSGEGGSVGAGGGGFQ